MLICICVFSFSAYQLYDIYREAHMITEETKDLEQHVVKKDTKKDILEPDWDILKKENEDIVAWIYVPGLDWSFPVVQGQDNTYYLNHTAKKENNYRGAIFMDYKSQPEFKDGNTIIYGHSVEGGGMFTDLKKFADEPFFQENKYFYILTPTQNYRCDIFTFSKTKERSVYYSPAPDYSALDQMKMEATYYHDVDPLDKNLVTLSTCDLDYGFDSINRLILNAVLEPTDKPIELKK